MRYLFILLLSALLVTALSAILLTAIFYRKYKEYQNLKADYKLLCQENIYLRKRLEEMAKQHQAFRFLHHELKNDYILEMNYLNQKLYAQLEEHYRKKAGCINYKTSLIHTGNIGMDAILNHKRETARKEQIHIDIHHQILAHVRIDNRDLSMILGNLIDNALEAVRKLTSGQRSIALRIKADTTTLFLEISNKYLGIPKKDIHGNYLTLKPDRCLHGQGLSRVKLLAKKYGGGITICDKDNHFHVKVLLYMPE